MSPAESTLEPTLLTVADAARRTKLHAQTIRRAIKQGRLRAVRLGPATIRIRPEDLEAYLTAAPAD